MAYPDLTPYRAVPDMLALAVGWLDAARPFPRGSVAPELLERLSAFCASPVVCTTARRAYSLCGDSPIAVGSPAPDFRLPTLAGEPLSLTAVRAERRATLVTFWYATCVPCRRELPELQRLYQEFSDHGFTVVAVNTGDSPEAVYLIRPETEAEVDVIWQKLDNRVLLAVRGQPTAPLHD